MPAKEDVSEFVDVIVSSAGTTLQISALRSLIYFDIFSYPLRAEEVFRFCNNTTADQVMITDALSDLVDRGNIFHLQGFYGIRPLKNMLKRRKAGNDLATKRMRKAEKVCQLIGKFPYVEAVMISGSLSKGYMASDGDIDQFIITTPGRLWIARTLLVLYKKVFLLNSHRDLCVNYFITSDDLRIEDENLFTATELITLLPMVNVRLHKELLRNNAWATKRFPNFRSDHRPIQQVIAPNFLRRSTEWITRGKFGDKLDGLFMRITVAFWQRKFKKFDVSLFDVALRSRKNVSKHHPNNFQQKVLDAFAERVTKMYAETGIDL